MLFFVDSVGESVGTFLVELADEVFEVREALPSEELLEGHGWW